MAEPRSSIHSFTGPGLPAADRRGRLGVLERVVFDVRRFADAVFFFTRDLLAAISAQLG